MARGNLANFKGKRAAPFHAKGRKPTSTKTAKGTFKKRRPKKGK